MFLKKTEFNDQILVIPAKQEAGTNISVSALHQDSLSHMFN